MSSIRPLTPPPEHAHRLALVPEGIRHTQARQEMPCPARPDSNPCSCDRRYNYGDKTALQRPAEQATVCYMRVRDKVMWWPWRIRGMALTLNTVQAFQVIIFPDVLMGLVTLSAVPVSKQSTQHLLVFVALRFVSPIFSLASSRHVVLTYPSSGYVTSPVCGSVWV